MADERDLIVGALRLARHYVIDAEARLRDRKIDPEDAAEQEAQDEAMARLAGLRAALALEILALETQQPAPQKASA